MTVLETILREAGDGEKVKTIEDYYKETEGKDKQAEEAAKDAIKAIASKRKKEAAEQAADIKKEQGTGPRDTGREGTQER